MKASNSFKQTIEAHLQGIGSQDPAFAEKLANPSKNIDDCITYILNWVKASGAYGFTDEEIFGQAIHYYDEEKIDIGKPVKCSVVVNQHVELAEEDIQAAKQAAINEVIAKEKARITSKRAHKKEESNVEQASLF
jgi:hypothetical protein